MLRGIAVFAFLMLVCTLCHADGGSSTLDATSAIAKAAEKSMELTLPKNVPDGIAGALVAGKDVIDAAKAKQYFAMSAGCIWFIMLFIKIGRKNFSFMQNMSKRWLYIIVAMLTLIATLLTKFQADLSWSSALIVLTSGPFAAYINDLVKRGVFNKTPSKDS